MAFGKNVLQNHKWKTVSREPKYFLELAIQKMFIAYLLCAEPVLEAGDVPGAKPALRSPRMGLQGLEQLLLSGA